MSVEEYYQLELKAQKITLEGKKEKLSCLQKKRCSNSKLYAIDEKYLIKVSDLYYKHKTTPAKIVLYYTQNEDKLKEYLLKQQEIKNILDDNLEKFEELSQNIKTRKEQTQ